MLPLETLKRSFPFAFLSRAHSLPLRFLAVALLSSNRRNDAYPFPSRYWDSAPGTGSKKKGVVPVAKIVNVTHCQPAQFKRDNVFCISYVRPITLRMNHAATLTVFMFFAAFESPHAPARFDGSSTKSWHPCYPCVCACRSEHAFPHVAVCSITLCSE
jgi:hypothetical protein